MTRRSWGCAIGAIALVACATSNGEPMPADAPPATPGGESGDDTKSELPPAVGGPEPEPAEAGGPPDDDPDKDLDPVAPSPPDDPALPAATQAQLIQKFAPHLHLHPMEANKPANVDWYLARVRMRFHHSLCPDHNMLDTVTQQTLIAQSHEDTNVLCSHSGSKLASTASDKFFLEIKDHATYAGAPRAEWKTYVVWRPQTGGNVNIEYWFFYPFNDGLLAFNHESDWEHVRVTIDPKGADNQGKIVEVKFSAHQGGTYVKAGDAKLELDEGLHPISYVAKGTHANYPKPGTYDIPDAVLAKDTAVAGPAASIWKTETALVHVGTRAAPKNGQVFIKYWGKWGELGTTSNTSGVTRHFP